MPDYPPLSQLPGFIPAPQPGTPEFKAFVVQVFTNPSANAAFAASLSRLAAHTHEYPLLAQSVLEETAGIHV